MTATAPGSSNLAKLSVDSKVLEFYFVYALTRNFGGVMALANYYRTCFFLRDTIIYFLYRTVIEDYDSHLVVDIAENFPMLRHRVFDEIEQREDAVGLKEFVLRIPEFQQ